MTTKSRRSRAAETEEAVADALRGLFPLAQTKGMSTPGKDVLNTTGLAVEVKAQAKYQPQAWLRQAVQNADPDEVPLVVQRFNGQGLANVREWGVLLRVGDLLALLDKAGFGYRMVPND